jgi:hypothetical protein
LTETNDLLIGNFRDTENTYGGAEDNVDYVRFGNVKFSAQSPKITYQAYQEDWLMTCQSIWTATYVNISKAATMLSNPARIPKTA